MNNSSSLTESFNHGFAYWLYGGFSLLSAIFVWKFVPESKGVSLEDMKKIWKKD
jgi:SP family xylose:H+ symportor-like MFS transporter